MAINNPIVTDSDWLQATAVAIQNKDGGGQMTVDEMPTRIEQNLQSKAVLDSVIDGSVTSIESDVTNVIGYAFANCTNMESCNLRNVTALPSYTFYRSGIRNLYAPSTIMLASCSFYQAYYVTRLFFPNVEEIGKSSFEYCKRLSTIVLHKHANLQDSNIFDNDCPAIIYVKQEDLSWYSTATNWSTLYAQDRIKSIEDLTGDDLAWYQEQLARYQAQTA